MFNAPAPDESFRINVPPPRLKLPPTFNVPAAVPLATTNVPAVCVKLPPTVTTLAVAPLAIRNVLLPVELAGLGRPGRERGLHLLDRVGLGDRLQTFPDRLSGGEQQRVAIARALAHDPLLILADEPTGNLDEDTGRQVLALLDELTREVGKSLLMATHSPEVVGLADRVYRVRHGKLIQEAAEFHAELGD